MAYPYPTNMTIESNYFTELFQYINMVTNNSFGLILLLIIFIITLTTFYLNTREIKPAVIGGLFITFVLSIPLALVGLTPFYYTFLPLLLLLLAVFIPKWGPKMFPYI